MQTVYGILVLLAVTCSYAQSQESSPPLATAYHVFGRCHDYGTALGLKASVYAIFGQTRTKLTECPETGNFDVLLPVSATHLALEMEGYRPVVVPVHFTTYIPSQARFSLSILTAMAKLDSLPVPLDPDKDSYLVLYFAVADNLDVRYHIARG